MYVPYLKGTVCVLHVITPPPIASYSPPSLLSPPTPPLHSARGLLAGLIPSATVLAMLVNAAAAAAP